MSPDARHDHTVRLLEGRLEELARASERRPGCGEQRLETSILAALAATRHAVRLGLLTTGEADSIWASAADRHPSWRHAASRPSRTGPATSRLGRAGQRAKLASPDVAASSRAVRPRPYDHRP